MVEQCGNAGNAKKQQDTLIFLRRKRKMESIDNLIRLGYELKIGDDGINCSCVGKGRPDESAVSSLYAAIMTNAAAALEYAKSIVRLDILVTKCNEAADSLSVTAYDVYGNEITELKADMTGTEDEVGAFIWLAYFSNPLLGFIHSYAKGEYVIAYMSRIFVPVAADDELAARCPW
jgi:hypothetical protein